MKLNTSLLIVTLACGTLWAQAPAQKSPTPAAKNAPAAKAPATPAKTMAPAPQKPKTAEAPKSVIVPHAPKPAVAKAPMKAKPPVMAKSVSHAPKKAEKAGEVKPAAVKETTRTAAAGKMRDPFVSPVVRSNGVISSGCDTGKRCLVVDQIELKGIVKSPSGFIAVVENPAKRAYFMRENDPVFNGKVVKITFDTIVFQEEVLDKVGKQSTREVVKKVNAPIV